MDKNEKLMWYTIGAIVLFTIFMAVQVFTGSKSGAGPGATSLGGGAGA